MYINFIFIAQLGWTGTIDHAEVNETLRNSV